MRFVGETDPGVSPEARERATDARSERPGRRRRAYRRSPTHDAR